MRSAQSSIAPASACASIRNSSLAACPLFRCSLRVPGPYQERIRVRGVPGFTGLELTAVPDQRASRAGGVIVPSSRPIL